MLFICAHLLTFVDSLCLIIGKRSKIIIMVMAFIISLVRLKSLLILLCQGLFLFIWGPLSLDSLLILDSMNILDLLGMLLMLAK